MRGKTWLPYGALAVTAHALVFFTLRAPPLSSAPMAAEPAAATPMDVEFEPAAIDALSRLTSVPPVPEPRGPTPAEAQTSRRGATPASGAATPSTAPEGSPDVAPSNAPSADRAGSPWAFDPTNPLDVTAPAFVARALRTGTDDGAARPAAGQSTTGGVAEGLDAHDVAIGLGRGGPVLAALESAAAIDEAPEEGRAMFDVSIDSAGLVSVVLLEASSLSADWAKVGEVARVRLDPRSVRVPPGARGLHVVTSIEAGLRYPNGVDPKKLGTHVETSGFKMAENKDGASGGPPVLFEKLPGVTIAHAGKVCSVSVTLGLTLSPISGGCDPANIGTHPVRVVHGRIVQEGRL